MVTTMKCFDRTSAARNELDINAVANGDTQVISDLQHLKCIRDKHISHDESDWLQSVPTAIIDEIDGIQPFGGVHGMVIRGESANADNIARLRRVVATTLTWVEHEWNESAEMLSDDVSSLSKADLATLPRVFGNMPYECSVRKNRGKTV